MASNTQKNEAKFDVFSSGQTTSNSLSFISAFLFFFIEYTYTTLLNYKLIFELVLKIFIEKKIC